MRKTWEMMGEYWRNNRLQYLERANKKFEKERQLKNSLNTQLKNFEKQKESKTSEFTVESDDDDFEGEEKFFKYRPRPQK